MKMAQILQAIQQLALSQGLYGRIYRSLQDLAISDPEAYLEVTAELEAKDFKDTLDVVLYFEE